MSHERTRLHLVFRVFCGLCARFDRVLRVLAFIVFAAVGLALATAMVGAVAWSVLEWLYVFFPQAFAFVGARLPV
jgi:hypothetical protein